MPTHGECSDEQEHLHPIKKHPNHSKCLEIRKCDAALPLSPSSSLAFRLVDLLPICLLVSWDCEFMCSTLVRNQFLCVSVCIYVLYTCVWYAYYIYLPAPEESRSHTKPPPAHLRAYQRFLCRYPSLPAPAARSWPWEMQAMKAGEEKLLRKVQ